jgi:hypothetical protein
MLSQPARKKLAVVIGQIICRSIDDARNIPYLLEHDEVIDILVRDPAKFANLVNQEQDSCAQYSADTLTAQLDAASDLGQLEVLDRYDISFGGDNSGEEDLKPAVNEIHQLTRIFAVYVGNTFTLFEKSFDTFSSKLHASLHGSGQSLELVNLDLEDVTGIEAGTEKYLAEGRYLQALLVDRLLSTKVVTKRLVTIPDGYSLSARLIQRTWEGESACAFTRFLLRATYVSQGSWEDYFHTAVRISGERPHWRAMLAEAIEQDSIFCCNFLRQSFADLKCLPAHELRDSIGQELQDRSSRWTTPEIKEETGHGHAK